MGNKNPAKMKSEKLRLCLHGTEIADVKGNEYKGLP
jgi:hypothetical protein